MIRRWWRQKVAEFRLQLEILETQSRLRSIGRAFDRAAERMAKMSPPPRQPAQPVREVYVPLTEAQSKVWEANVWGKTAAPSPKAILASRDGIAGVNGWLRLTQGDRAVMITDETLRSLNRLRSGR